MSAPLTPSRLAIANLQRRPWRTVGLILTAAALAFALFGGAVLRQSWQRGLNALAQRLGADLLVVPIGAAEKTEALLIGVSAGYFYFDRSVLDAVKNIDGVAQVSPQFFLTSFSDECCDAGQVQLIAYDPETDFAIHPWLAELTHGVADGQLLIGADIFTHPSADHRFDEIKFFGTEYPVAAKLARTGTGFDNSVLMTMATIRQMMADARRKLQIHFLADLAGENPLSAVLVKTSAQPAAVARAIKKKIPDVEVVVAGQILDRFANVLRGFSAGLNFLLSAIWILATLVLLLIFVSQIHERQKEFALLRLLGATKKRVVGIVLREAGFVGILGGVIGIGGASLLIFPFTRYLGSRLQLSLMHGGASELATLCIGVLAITVATAIVAATWTAIKISGAEVYFSLRDGEK